LDYCDPNFPASYLCVITGGVANPQEDAFIEWFYHIEVEQVTGAARSFITGKFTFSASAAYINHWWKQSSSYTGPFGPTGIPMFVQPSHNQF
jgi:hypothetical protein